MARDPLEYASQPESKPPRGPLPAWLDWTLVGIFGLFFLLLLAMAVSWFATQFR